MFQILVIDDDPSLRLILQKQLQSQGYAVTLASSGEEGITQARRSPPALIICDWQMSGMSGLEVCRQIKSDPTLATAFFVLLTARTAVEDRIEGLDTGADDFLPKPIDVSELKARVRAGLRLYRAHQELQQLANDLQTQKQILEAELAEAAQYVRSLLPAPITGEVEIDAKFLPSRQLGGDCFDFYWLDTNHLVAYLIDMSGHGLGSALPSVSVQNLLRTQSLPNTNFYQPDAVLKTLNDVFQMGQHNDQYFTIWYGVYDKQTQQLTYASAGHPPALLMTKSVGEEVKAIALKTPGVPIGMFADAQFVSQKYDIHSSDKLYVFSDGVYEIKQSNQLMWTLNEFTALLLQCAATNNLEVEQVLQQVQALHGRETFEDDCSLLQIYFH